MCSNAEQQSRQQDPLCLENTAARPIFVDKFVPLCERKRKGSSLRGGGVCAMPGDFHEHYAVGEVSAPSERATGLVFAAVAVIVALLWRNSPTVPWVALAIAGGLAAISLIAPTLLKPLNVLWFRFGLLLHRIVNPVVMFAIFALVFVPTGMLMRIWRDPLRSRRLPTSSSYWIDRRETDGNAGSMTNQF
jgi:hypothetical protein